MRSYEFTVLLLIFAIIACIGVAQTTAGLIIFSPNDGQRVYTSTVRVRYELTNGVAGAGTPMFRLGLDGQDVALTTDTVYTFTGLRLGTHTVTVLLVDANGTPVAEGQDQVQFWVTTFTF